MTGGVKKARNCITSFMYAPQQNWVTPSYLASSPKYATTILSYFGWPWNRTISSFCKAIVYTNLDLFTLKVCFRKIQFFFYFSSITFFTHVYLINLTNHTYMHPTFVKISLRPCFSANGTINGLLYNK